MGGCVFGFGLAMVFILFDFVVGVVLVVLVVLVIVGVGFVGVVLVRTSNEHEKLNYIAVRQYSYYMSITIFYTFPCFCVPVTVFIDFHLSLHSFFHM